MTDFKRIEYASKPLRHFVPEMGVAVDFLREHLDLNAPDSADRVRSMTREERDQLAVGITHVLMGCEHYLVGFSMIEPAHIETIMQTNPQVGLAVAMRAAHFIESKENEHKEEGE